MRKGCKHLRIASILVIALGVISIIVNIVLLVIPYYYLHNAYRNYKE